MRSICLIFKNFSFLSLIDSSRRGERDLQAAVADGHGETVLCRQAHHTFSIAPVSHRGVLWKLNFTVDYLMLKLYPSFTRSRCLSSSKNSLKDSLLRNGNSCASHAVGSDSSSSGSASILTTQERLSHNVRSLSSCTPDVAFGSKDSDPYHQPHHHLSTPQQPDNLPTPNTQSEGK